MKNICVLVSGGGTNLQSVIDAIENGEIRDARIAGVISSKKDVYALERAKKHGIPSKIIMRKAYESPLSCKKRCEYTPAIRRRCSRHG